MDACRVLNSIMSPLNERDLFCLLRALFHSLDTIQKRTRIRRVLGVLRMGDHMNINLTFQSSNIIAKISRIC